MLREVGYVRHRQQAATVSSIVVPAVAAVAWADEGQVKVAYCRASAISECG